MNFSPNRFWLFQQNLVGTLLGVWEMTAILKVIKLRFCTFSQQISPKMAWNYLFIYAIAYIFVIILLFMKENMVSHKRKRYLCDTAYLWCYHFWLVAFIYDHIMNSIIICPYYIQLYPLFVQHPLTFYYYPTCHNFWQPSWILTNIAQWFPEWAPTCVLNFRSSDQRSKVEFSLEKLAKNLNIAQNSLSP